MSDKPILLISGTNRPGSNSLRVANVLLEHYRKAQINVELLSLAELPSEMFDPSSYATKPPSVLALQKRVLDALGLHIVTPEYNGSFSGVLKYFIDMLKFPESFERKPVAFTGVANGVWGGLRPVEQLQMIFSYRNAYAYPDRVFLPQISSKFDAKGRFSDPVLNERLLKQAAGFARFAAHVRALT